MRRSVSAGRVATRLVPVTGIKPWWRAFICGRSLTGRPMPLPEVPGAEYQHDDRRRRQTNAHASGRRYRCVAHGAGAVNRDKVKPEAGSTHRRTASVFSGMACRSVIAVAAKR